MKILFSNEFWTVDHPLVQALKDGEITPEEFLDKKDVTDPFVITDRDHVDPANVEKWITGFGEVSLERQIESKKRQQLHNFRRMLGLTPTLLEKHEDVLKEAFPFLISKYEEFHLEVKGGCTSCKKNALASQMIQLLSNMAPYDESTTSLLEEHLDNRIIRCMRKEEISDEELMAGIDLSPFDKMKVCKTITREDFFTSDACQRGQNKENCKACRSSLEHRQKLTREYQIGMQQTTKINDVNVSSQIYNHPYDVVNFECPYKEEVTKLYPGMLEQFKNVAGATLRVFRAMLGSKNVLLANNLTAERLAVCNNCEYHDKDMGRCTVCACFIRAKMQLATEKCPMEKWPELPTQ